MKDERFLNRCCCDNLKDVADTTRLKVTVAQSCPRWASGFLKAKQLED